MFSTRPRTGKASFLVKESDFTVSLRAVFCGVVMRTEDGVVGLSGVGLKRGCRWVMSEICSSDVPASLATRVSASDSKTYLAAYQ